MPAQNRYDRELVFEEAEFFARRHGRATLELDRLALQIGVAASGDAATCAKCAQPLASLFFSSATGISAGAARASRPADAPRLTAPHTARYARAS